MAKDNLNSPVSGTKVIQGLDIFDVVAFVGKKNRKFQAILLQEIEDVLGRDHPDYMRIRGLILDSYNNYTRSVLRVIFGNDFDL